MKKVLFIVLVACAMATVVSVAAATNLPARQTDTRVDSVRKKHKRTVKRRTTTRRTQMQLQQANKHLKDEKKVQRTQRELKRDTARHL